MKRKDKLALYRRLYKPLTKNDAFCIYCGEPAQVIDHVPALSSAHIYYKKDFDHFYLVNSCTECNTVLGGADIPKLHNRSKHLIGKYLIKYKKELETPGWTGEQLGEMGPKMKKFIKEWGVARARIRERIGFLEGSSRRLKYNYVD